jgi:hypothetical protein
MPEATFVVRLDDFQGFVVAQRYPLNLVLNEKVLNLIFYEKEKEAKEELSLSEIENMRIASFNSPQYSGWMVCSILSPAEDFENIRNNLAGSGRLILALITENPEDFSLEEILQSGSVLTDLTDEQLFAQIFLTPSSALLLERMQSEGVEIAAKLSIWLKSQVQDEVDLRQAMTPLMQSGVVVVELLGKTSEMIFLVKDILGCREPPVDAIKKTRAAIPDLAQRYLENVEEFFSPPPPSKGYNPTLPITDPNSPILEDIQNSLRAASVPSSDRIEESATLRCRYLTCNSTP